MLFLREANMADAEKEFKFITELPTDENGFTNKFYRVSKEEFIQTVLPQMINESKGLAFKQIN
ncbi:hypothetical protein [Muricomes intestini]|jgi:hypothetical protein|uniref:Acetyltransferase (GNAT) family protein n=1 Tax=Muricomes intestini TaxID=1796634 RepID=A0A4R3JYJ1_9FIRM|nr:hypothetical protein [Muricomes intestini]TCS72343.1 hypothetical protein EDD59_1532 [Muricomes intestini]HAX50394.1 hypothetical protein [Lachnospiraceae bacterium]